MHRTPKKIKARRIQRGTPDYDEPISLHPLQFSEAVAALFGAPPTKKPETAQETADARTEEEDAPGKQTP